VNHPNNPKKEANTMVDTDNWDSEEGYICNGAVINFVELSTAVVAGEPLAFGTAAANKIVMKKYALSADSIAVALKGGVTGDKIPACFYGVVKMYSGSTITAGNMVCNDASGRFLNTLPELANVTAGVLGYASMFRGGTLYRLGLALQNGQGATTGCELLVLIGGLR